MRSVGEIKKGHNLLLYVVIVLYSRFKLKYIKFYFSDLLDYHKAQFFTKLLKNTLVCLYDFYLKFNEVKDDIIHQHDVNANDDMEVNDIPGILVQFKKYLEK